MEVPAGDDSTSRTLLALAKAAEEAEAALTHKLPIKDNEIGALEKRMLPSKRKILSKERTTSSERILETREATGPPKPEEGLAAKNSDEHSE